MKLRRTARGDDHWHLYVVRCSDGTLYTGITTSLQRRLAQHNAGRASHYTRSRRPVELVYQEQCRGRSAALRKEYAFKQLPKRRKEVYIAEQSVLGTL